MNIAGIDYESVRDGEGVRTAIYVSGCSHRCFNCHNPQTHNSNYGILFTEKMKYEIVENMRKRQFVSGITWSGGDPLHKNNIYDVLAFTNEFRLLFPQKTVWLYSGYTWEKLFEIDEFDIREGNCENQIRREIVLSSDIFVDGRYIDSRRDITLAYRGSSNQRLIDVKKSVQKGEVVLWTI